MGGAFEVGRCKAVLRLSHDGGGGGGIGAGAVQVWLCAASGLEGLQCTGGTTASMQCFKDNEPNGAFDYWVRIPLHRATFHPSNPSGFRIF